ncbi:ParA family protein [Cereibacter azotoformans]|uniref:Chromosome partitioning protein n=1 Tax=Cereibacter azotoformans TaxID=43057 RepID=A0A2T5KDF8_9RHOB|nr:ParA family protein [Cereibacter azotoformans]MBO4168571.1 ParA family protein [Cereibacter azotoformans]PTR20439.1 chromosome partitioning protein [Cereibacter azotoformans]UIJ31997.1 ParA family protein [Cereibacter azotoformans]
MRVMICNQKGGVGKTTTAANLGAALARAGAGRVLLVDLDPQMHLTAGLGLPAEGADWTVADWLAGRPGEPLPVPGEAGLWLVPGAAEPLAALGAGVPTEGLGASFDWVLMDAPPTWSEAIADLMRGSDLVICPLEPDFLGLQGLNRLLRTMQGAGLDWSRLRLLATRVSDRLAVHREVRARLAERFGESFLPVAIRSSVKLAEAPGRGRTIFTHAPASTGAADHAELARLLMRGGRGARRKGTRT